MLLIQSMKMLQKIREGFYLVGRGSWLLIYLIWVGFLLVLAYVWLVIKSRGRVNAYWQDSMLNVEKTKRCET